jgi:hypothetical protein
LSRRLQAAANSIQLPAKTPAAPSNSSDNLFAYTGSRIGGKRHRKTQRKQKSKQSRVKKN